MDYVFNRSIVGKGNCISPLEAEEGAADYGFVGLFLDRFNIEWSFRISSTPYNRFMRKARGFDRIGNQRIISVIDDSIAIDEELEFLAAFLPHRDEILLMRLTNAGYHADGRGNDRLQILHFVRLRDTRLENTQGMPFVHFPDGKRDANLRIIAPRRTHNVELAAQ